MNKIRTIEQLNKQEIEAGTPPSASWHRDYDSAYIYAGGLPYNLSEGDVLTIFSQYGEPVWVKLGRDRDTGKSKGFAFLKYEDQRSTDLAVDNLSGAEVLGRKINVDHKVFKDGEVPEEDDEEGMRLMAELYAQDEEDPSKNGDGREGESGRPVLKEEMELQELMQMDDDDPMKASMVQRKQEEVTRAVKKWTKQSRKHKSSSRHHGHRHHHRSRTERLENGHAGHGRDHSQSIKPDPEDLRGRHQHHTIKQESDLETNEKPRRRRTSSESRSRSKDRHKTKNCRTHRRRYS